jgi:hypothetical protein
MQNDLEQAILEVCNLDCKKHIKIYKLNKLWLPNAKIAGTLGTNAGHVYNVLKDYETNPAKKEKADLIF